MESKIVRQWINIIESVSDNDKAAIALILQPFKSIAGEDLIVDYSSNKIHEYQISTSIKEKEGIKQEVLLNFNYIQTLNLRGTKEILKNLIKLWRTM